MKTSSAAIACLSAALLLLFISSGTLAGGMWDPTPLTVHEWGVNTFDWDRGDRLQQELPDFLYTDQKPGKPAAPTAERVRDLPADSGVRTKPILYFYPMLKYAMDKPPQVGVEMRFAGGYANAWWPQVNRYRTEAESLAAKAPDWDGWMKQMLPLVEKAVKGNGTDPKAIARWEAEMKTFHSLDEPDQIAWLANRTAGWYRTEPNFPEDDRMQLTWDRLTLHETVPEGLALPGEDLPTAHWVKIAREVDAAYVSNGSETERFVFYEGKTRERPAIAVLPESTGPAWLRSHPREGEPQGVAVINVGEHPIYDVIAVYRDREKDILWTGHVPVMPALPDHRPRVDQVVALRVPDFNGPSDPVAAHTRLEAAEFDRLTRERLIEALTAGYHYDPGGVTMRDPADPQPPARMHQLFPKEAIALERIWHDDFFESDGLTVIYRESPAYLDEAMPLHIYTSMFQYVKLSRCGLVLNRNLPIAQVYAVDRALREFQIAQYNDRPKADVEKARATLRSNRFLTLGMARYRYGRKGGGFWGGSSEGMMEKLEGLFE